MRFLAVAVSGLIVLIALYVAAACANSRSKILAAKLAPIKAVAFNENLKESSWLGNITFEREKQKFLKDSGPHLNVHIRSNLVNTHSNSTNDQYTSLPKWKYKTFADAGSKVHVVDMYPHLSLSALKMPLYDGAGKVVVLPEQLTEKNANFYETLPNGQFRYMVNCTSSGTSGARTPHSDFPWKCFPCPCSRFIATEQSLYDMNRKICICRDELTHNDPADESSPCIPKQSKQYYDSSVETLQIRVPCWNGETSTEENTVYPCSSLNSSTHSLASQRIRFRKVPENAVFSKHVSAVSDLAIPDEYLPFIEDPF